jgi:hypothetical protein
MLGSRADSEILTRALVGILTVKLETPRQPAAKLSYSLEQFLDVSHVSYFSLWLA